MVEKRCPQCQQTYPIEEFGFRHGGTRRHSWCLPCRRANRPHYGGGKSARFAATKALLGEGKKVCIGCQVVLPLDEFRQTHGGKYYASRCRGCAQAWQKAWRQTEGARAKSKAALMRRLAADPTLQDRMRAARRADYHRNRVARLATSATNPNLPSHWRTRRLKKYYGMTNADYAALVAAQDGRCAICRQEPRDKRRRLAVDHDHTSGKVRALLCSHCNTALGNFRDNIERLQAAIDYLQRFQPVEQVA